MKTSVLFIVACIIGFSVYAQNSTRLNQLGFKAKPFTETDRVDATSSSNAILPAYVPHTFKGANMDVKKVLMGTSRNVNTLLVQEQNCMYYNKELNAIMGTFRGNNKASGTLPLLGTGNDICTYWSTDKGTTFTGKLSLTVTGSNFRYPSGVIYNRPGNTLLSDAYTVLGGPQTVTAWDNTYLSSVQYNGNNFAVIQPATSTYKELVRLGMNACTDGTAHIAAQKYSTDYKTAIGLVYNGVFNSNTNLFEWAPVDVPIPFNVAADGTLDGFFGTGNMAWSKDGSVGYLMYKGVDARHNSHLAYQPILMKSVDKGVTWQNMDYFDFGVFKDIHTYLWPTEHDTSLSVPWFIETDMVVDAANNLHIMALCRGHALQHPDSLNYLYPGENGTLFEFSNENNQWFCHHIDYHMKTQAVPTASSPLVAATGNIGWNMRLQASRTDDGTKVFAAWTDTDYQFWGMTDSINLYPDVLIWGRDINTNGETPVKNVTYLQEGMGESYFMFVSPIAMDNAGVYDIPLSISDINTSALNADEPIAHYYLQGATLTEADFLYFVGNKDVNKVNPLKVVNYPNPFSGTTKIDINIEKSVPVSLSVCTLTGQQVSSVNYGTMSVGLHTLTFDAGNLASGIYFYTLTTGDQKATSKMVIK